MRTINMTRPETPLVKILTRCAIVVLMGLLLTASMARAEDAADIDLSKNPRLVKYKLGKLSNEQLLGLHRSTDDPKYKPIYEVMLTRAGLTAAQRDEAIKGIATIDKTDPAAVLVTALGALNPDDEEDQPALALITNLLIAQEPADLAVQRMAVMGAIRATADDKKTKMLPGLAQRCLDHLKGLPADQKDSDDAVLVGALCMQVARELPVDQEYKIASQMYAAGVHVLSLRALHEMMIYDKHYFAVPAGTMLHIIFDNTDVMQHNLVIGMPGKLNDIGMAAAVMQPTADLTQKQFIPDLPAVLHSSLLINPGGSTRMDCKTPEKPGEYLYLCTFPGHFFKMYGVLIVTDDPAAWFASPKPPTDPLAGKPYATSRNEEKKP
ncbi:MAG: hypothetical protein GC162_09895 [Planctomycetes bacterium]|nr:hypothetical protein [Planctomycetota bacterium]